jgi:hypothetical protein
MRIGEIAGRAGVPAKTIRFWEDQRLLPPQGRTPAGYRDYPGRPEPARVHPARPGRRAHPRRHRAGAGDPRRRAAAVRARNRPDRPAAGRGGRTAGRTHPHPRPAGGAGCPGSRAGPCRLPRLLLDHRQLNPGPAFLLTFQSRGRLTVGGQMMPPRQELVAMELVVLTVPDCPNAAAFEENLAAALTGLPDAVIRRHIIASEQEAADAACTARRPCWSAAPTRSPRRASRPACRAGCTGTPTGGPGRCRRCRSCGGC